MQKLIVIVIVGLGVALFPWLLTASSKMQLVMQVGGVIGGVLADLMGSRWLRTKAEEVRGKLRRWLFALCAVSFVSLILFVSVLSPTVAELHETLISLRGFLIRMEVLTNFIAALLFALSVFSLTATAVLQLEPKQPAIQKDFEWGFLKNPSVIWVIISLVVGVVAGCLTWIIVVYPELKIRVPVAVGTAVAISLIPHNPIRWMRFLIYWLLTHWLVAKFILEFDLFGIGTAQIGEKASWSTDLAILGIVVTALILDYRTNRPSEQIH